MNNCLVKKLNATVNDSEKKMEYFGGFIVTLKGNTAGSIANVQIGQNMLAKFVDNDAYFVAGASDPTNLGVEITTPNQVYYVPNHSDPVRVFIKPTENTTSASSYTHFVDMNVNKCLMYTPKIVSINQEDISSARAVFKSYDGCFKNMVFFKLPYASKETEVNLAHITNDAFVSGSPAFQVRGVSEYEKIKIIGSISAFGNCTSTNTLIIDIINADWSYNTPSEAETNTVEALAEAMIANGRTSGSVTLRLMDTAVTYQGNPITYFNTIITFTTTGSTTTYSVSQN